MKFLVAPLLLTPLIALSACAATDAAWNVVDHIPVDRIILQSHRGAGVLAEENTLPAFELAWSLGTYPESDVRTTRDGVIVAFHDANFARVVKDASPELKQKGVQDVTFDELSQLDVGSWMGGKFVGRRVPRMSEIFAAMNGRPERHLYLDIKSVDLSRLAAEVKAAGIERQVVLASPKPEIIREWKTFVPESETLLWMRGSERQLNQRLDALRATKFAGITQIQIHIFPNQTIEQALEIAHITPDKIEVSLDEARRSPEPFTLSRAFIRALGDELRSHGIVFQAFPYTSDSGVYAQLLDLGLASFATDHPDVTVRELRAYYARRTPAAR